MVTITPQSRLRMMRILLMYDLPSTTKAAQKIYREFNGFLLKNGFYMIQESIYCCFAKSYITAKLIITKVKKHSPKLGDVRCLMITEKQYQEITLFSGRKSFQEELFSPEPILEI